MSRKMIDCHTHILNQKLLDQYYKTYKPEAILAFRFFKGFANGLFDNIEEDFDMFLRNNDNVFILEAINVDNDIESEMEKFSKRVSESNKVRGAKLYLGYQHIYPFDKRLDSLYRFCQEKKLMVQFHNGVHLDYPNSRALIKYSLPIHIDELACQYPDLTFVISHLGFPNLFDTACIVYKHANVFTDISGVIDSDTCEEAYKQDLKHLLKYYPGIVNKIMFATDFLGGDTVLNYIEPYIRVVEECIPKQYHENVFYQTAKRVYRLDNI